MAQTYGDARSWKSGKTRFSSTLPQSLDNGLPLTTSHTGSITIFLNIFLILINPHLRKIKNNLHNIFDNYMEFEIDEFELDSKRLSKSKFSSPHFYITMEINMDNCIEGRKKINETSEVKISFNDIIIKATAAALRKHPMINSSYLEDKLRTNHHIHIGVAVAVKDGLLVPIIKFADNKSLSHISLEVKDLANRAKNKNLQPSDWEGNTFTISNLGMYGIDEFTAIINPNDSCILAVGGIKNTPIIKNGEIVPGNLMKVTLSCDHRIVDGASGSAFLQTLKELIEDPIKILV